MQSAKKPSSATPLCITSLGTVGDRLDRIPRMFKVALRKSLLRLEKPFRLRDLPAEIRTMIYHHAMVIDEDILIQPNSRDTVVNSMQDALSYKERKALKKLFNMSFLRTCREIHFEATAMFYRCNTFRSELTGDCKKLGMGDPRMRLASWLKCMGPTNVSYLSKMIIEHPNRRAPWTLLFRGRVVRWTYDWLNRHSIGGASLGLMDLVRDIMNYEYNQSESFQHVCNTLEAAGKIHILEVPGTDMDFFAVWPTRLCREHISYRVTRATLRTEGTVAGPSEDTMVPTSLGHWVVETTQTTTYERIPQRCLETGGTGQDEDEDEDEDEDNALELDFDFGQKLVYRTIYTP